MSLCLLPSLPLNSFGIRGKRSFVDSFFDDFDYMERALRPLRAARHSPDSAGKLEKVVNDDTKLSISLNDAKDRRQEEIKENKGYTMRTFVRQWTLPNEVDVEQVKSTLTEDGHLVVEAPKISKMSSTSRSIEIQKAAPAVKENGEINKQ